MTLSERFTTFRHKFRLDEMPPQQAMFLQGAYIAGAQASFQILATASDKTREEAIVIWHDLQEEILAAAPKPPPPLIATPPEKSLII